MKTKKGRTVTQIRRKIIRGLRGSNKDYYMNPFERCPNTKSELEELVNRVRATSIHENIYIFVE